MTDPGFLADTAVTTRSFQLAGLRGMACVFAFAMLVGVAAAGQVGPGEDFQSALTRLLGPQFMVLVSRRPTSS